VLVASKLSLAMIMAVSSIPVFAVILLLVGLLAAARPKPQRPKLAN
jgi:hypothetical protein